MKTKTTLRLLAATAIAGALTTAAPAAPKTGGTVYSKRNETKLLTEPKALAAPAATAGFAEPLKVGEIRGSWLNVAGRSGTGWVFSGLVSEDLPKNAPAAGFGTLDASSTTTAAAARPLAPAAEAYAQRHGKVEAGADVDWVEAQAHKVSPAIVNAYMKENKKGEFQE